jgi:hypothetical protein
MRETRLAILNEMTFKNFRSPGLCRKASNATIAARTIAVDVAAPARLATKSPERSAPTINNSDHAIDESSHAVPSAQIAAAGSLPNLTKRRNVYAVPAPGPIKGSVKEIAFPTKAVVAIHGIEMYPPIERNMIRWARAKVMMETSSNAKVAATQYPSALMAAATDRAIAVWASRAVIATATTATVSRISHGQERPTPE